MHSTVKYVTGSAHHAANRLLWIIPLDRMQVAAATGVQRKDVQLRIEGAFTMTMTPKHITVGQPRQ